ncbi:branched-chain amino acid ABC transporter permease [Pararoseomonas indoligenes]|uniref:Branched-chain amino acid ABC transporter permease n=1 Tax=Roseomonas indoligenes TaxID=2820811 RepID=A0A940MSJ4_9PROT|nr:branched-chain amino acid ABC transporter permease [Pararoseomonas indoligenes]MBP0492649.1 branched-chain amino acid ABC transporter permease [Pararoseomonas indoligenes]
MLTVLFDGIAYGMVLFILACGLAVTLGLMNLVNLAHGAFAMAGGYAALVLVNAWGVPFLAALPLVFLATAALGAVMERTLYAQVYARSHLDQVLFSVGLIFMAMAVVDYAAGPSQQFVRIPDALRGRIEVAGVGMGIYRLLVIGICGAVALALHLALARTRFGSQLRAAVDDARVARGLGIDVGLIFTVTFAVGSGLAGLGGALGADILGLDPGFPLRFMIYFLIVVTVGGTASIPGAFLASLLLGIADVAGKYYLPSMGAFIIYGVMLAVLVWRPQGLFGRAGAR